MEAKLLSTHWGQRETEVNKTHIRQDVIYMPVTYHIQSNKIIPMESKSGDMRKDVKTIHEVSQLGHGCES